MRRRPTKTLLTSVFLREAINPTRVSTDQCFSTSNEIAGESGTPGGTLHSDFYRHSHFSELLKEWGFTGAQLVLISDAMREAGLEFVEAENLNL